MIALWPQCIVNYQCQCNAIQCNFSFLFHCKKLLCLHTQASIAANISLYNGKQLPWLWVGVGGWSNLLIKFTWKKTDLEQLIADRHSALWPFFVPRQVFSWDQWLGLPWCSMTNGAAPEDQQHRLIINLDRKKGGRWQVSSGRLEPTFHRCTLYSMTTNVGQGNIPCYSWEHYQL